MEKEQSVDKLIPQVFDELRSNMDSLKYNSLSPITTQSLITELENLDKITEVINSINGSISDVISTDIGKIHDVCQSSNKLLDSWIGIQSQAGYIYRLMGEPTYVQNLKEDGIDNTFEEEIKLENESIEQIKKEIAKITSPPSVSISVTKNSRNNGTSIRNGTIRKQSTLVKRPTGIRRPTVTRERKLFRK